MKRESSTNYNNDNTYYNGQTSGDLSVDNSQNPFEVQEFNGPYSMSVEQMYFSKTAGAGSQDIIIADATPKKNFAIESPNTTIQVSKNQPISIPSSSKSKVVIIRDYERNENNIDEQEKSNDKVMVAKKIKKITSQTVKSSFQNLDQEYHYLKILLNFYTVYY